MALYYKIVFEVKLMHEYFLTTENGDTPFDKAAPQRKNFLAEEFSKNRESITRDIQAEFPEELRALYNDHELKLLPSYSGFRVVTRVIPKKQPDNSVVYEPVQPLPGNPGIIIHLTQRNNSVNSYTNARLSRATPAVYFFSNETQVSNTSHPFLTGSIEAVNNLYAYEQGELAFIVPGDLREFYRDTAGPKWARVPGNQFANENDRLLVPASFHYSFLNATGIKEAEFDLKNKNGDIISHVSAKDNAGLVSALLDFKEEKKLLFIGDDKPLAERIFTLEVSGTGGYSRTHKLIFSKSLPASNLWGAVHMQPVTTNVAFDLLHPDGFLVHRVDPAGNKTAAPVFEIPVKSRSTFWRYINNRGKNITLVPGLQDHLEKNGNMLVSLAPKAITQSNFKLLKPDQTTPKYVPNPLSYELKTEGLRIYLDIMVPESELFPVT